MHLRAGYIRDIATHANLDALERLDAHDRKCDVCIEFITPVDGRAESDRAPKHMHLAHAAECVLVDLRLSDQLALSRCNCIVRAVCLAGVASDERITPVCCINCDIRAHAADGPDKPKDLNPDLAEQASCDRTRSDSTCSLACAGAFERVPAVRCQRLDRASKVRVPRSWARDWRRAFQIIKAAVPVDDADRQRAADRFAQTNTREKLGAICLDLLSAAATVPALPAREPHWVAMPTMRALPERWAAPLVASGQLLLGTRVTALQPDALGTARWQLHTEGAAGATHVHAGFDAVMLALPAWQARTLLSLSERTKALATPLAGVEVAPCWTLAVAFPNAMQPGLQTLGPQWNAARSTHHRAAWLARESSKPGRSGIERWTIQASAMWSQEHAQDDAERVIAKLLKAFAEVTGIRATPAWVEAVLWRQAQAIKPLGRSHVWDAGRQLGLCGDWCLGHRVEDAFLSGLELALQAA